MTMHKWQFSLLNYAKLEEELLFVVVFLVCWGSCCLYSALFLGVTYGLSTMEQLGKSSYNRFYEMALLILSI